MKMYFILYLIETIKKEKEKGIKSSTNNKSSIKLLFLHTNFVHQRNDEEDEDLGKKITNTLTHLP